MNRPAISITVKSVKVTVSNLVLNFQVNPMLFTESTSPDVVVNDGIWVMNPYPKAIVFLVHLHSCMFQDRCQLREKQE